MKPSALSFVRSQLLTGLLFLATASSFCFAQERELIGIVRYTGSGMPVSGAAVYVADQIMSVTDRDGRFDIRVHTGDTLEISHMSVVDFSLVLDDRIADTLSIFMEAKSYTLNPAVILAPRPVAITEGSRFYVLDYELFGEGILLLGFRKGAQYRKEMILLGAAGDTLAAAPATGVGALMPDCTGDVWAVRSDSAFVVRQISGYLLFMAGESRENFGLWYPYLSGCYENAYFFQVHEMQGQVLNNYIYYDGPDTLMRFLEISDHEAMTRNSMGAYFDGNEADLRFQLEIMNRPVYAPLFVSGDSAVVFNFVENRCEVYNVEGERISVIPMEKTTKSWKLKSVVCDYASGHFYSVLFRNGTFSLSEFPGNRRVATISELLFPEKIRVRESICYFLCKPDKGSDVKHLYSFSFR